MVVLKGLNLALAFLLELAALAAVGAWGWRLGTSALTRVLPALAAAGGWALVWGLFLSPRRAVALPPVLVAAGQWLMFALAVAALLAIGRPRLALVVAVLVVLNRVLLLLWRQ